MTILPYPPSDPAATRGDLLLRDADGAGRRGADPFQAESVIQPAPGQCASGSEARRVNFMGLAGLAALGVSAGGVIAAITLIVSTLFGAAVVVMLAPGGVLG